MKYFKDSNTQEKFAFDDNVPTDTILSINANLLEMSQQEVQELFNPTKTSYELYHDAVVLLNASYQKDVDGYMLAFNNAALADGASQVTKQTNIKTMYQNRKAQYLSDLQALKTQYGV